MNDKQLEIIVSTQEALLLDSLFEQRPGLKRKETMIWLKELISNTEENELLETGNSLLAKINELSDLEFEEII